MDTLAISITAADAEDSALAAWLSPVDASDPCGADLEYENGFVALVGAVAGQAETQFAPGQPPDWSLVRRMVEQLNERSRDLRLACYWLRARLHLEGFAVLAPCLRLFKHLLTTWWDELHPRLDDGDAFGRANVLAEFAHAGALLRDVRQALVLDDRAIGQVSVRDIEVALGLRAPRGGEAALSQRQIEQRLADAAGSNVALAGMAAEAAEALDALEMLACQRFTGEQLPDFTPLRQIIRAVSQVSPAMARAPKGSVDAAAANGSALMEEADEVSRCDPRVGHERGAIESREDAVHCIGQVCDYLERGEPTNPAAHLLRRAQRLIDRNFLQLVREFAPDAVNEVARVLGLDAETLDAHTTN